MINIYPSTSEGIYLDNLNRCLKPLKPVRIPLAPADLQISTLASFSPEADTFMNMSLWATSWLKAHRQCQEQLGLQAGPVNPELISTLVGMCRWVSMGAIFLYM